jgi:hypothetical protein
VIEVAAFLGGGLTTVEDLCWLPVPSFLSAYESYSAIYANRLADDVTKTYVGAQVTGEGVDKYVASLRCLGQQEPPPEKETESDAARFIKKFGTKVGARKRR